MKKLLASLLLLASTAHAAESMHIDVYRDPNCGCCKAWIAHLTDSGFIVTDHVTSDMIELKQKLRVPTDLASCHTGVVMGRFVEGHVPASDVRRLAGLPDVAGIAVPGMPIGSPGMEMGSRQDPYTVVAVGSDGKRAELARYPQANHATP
ncbi:Uncharacterized conserved protein [Halopseudomonas xinjiangensis]|uniref:Uncharacterized conserved protein n=1 Tax=Halopseudomonas xinjiangensis TaxID=487184 RepID=A0A1H1QSW7_9GAMM|nr:DUF411 domain-containing protein [Halopseudomonas xinjiangensis]SDS26592.1 Uncharacterized conserved protein [Halopseudomonas xinjiangensis]